MSIDKAMLIASHLIMFNQNKDLEIWLKPNPAKTGQNRAKHWVGRGKAEQTAKEKVAKRLHVDTFTP